ncbi:MAG: class I SAM-dependent methyltransferase [Christensenellaceae bacterium]|jgi:ubiquinone/menaquinone biosynthesis C-methylase UbiE
MNEKMDLFQQKAEVYDMGRTGYSEAVFSLIARFFKTGKAADVGMGTGIFSEALLARGYEVYGVEIDMEMRRKAEIRLEKHPSFHAVAGSAEATTLLGNSMDFITVASAFHWFSKEAFQKECKRILKREGMVFLITNARDNDTALAKAQAEICRTFCPTFTSFSHGADATEKAYKSFFVTSRREVLQNDLIYTPETFLARSLSSSYSLIEQDEAFEPYKEALQALFLKYAEGGTMKVPNKTVVWYGAPA